MTLHIYVDGMMNKIDYSLRIEGEGGIPTHHTHTHTHSSQEHQITQDKQVEMV